MKSLLYLLFSWFILYEFASQYLLLFYDSVLVLACWGFTLLLINFQTKNLKNQFHFWSVWSLNVYFHFLFNVFIHASAYILWMKSLLYLLFSWFILYGFTSQYLILFYDSILVLACWIFTLLLLNFQTKNLKNQFPSAFIFEIVLACSSSSMGTISSTNIMH